METEDGADTPDPNGCAVVLVPNRGLVAATSVGLLSSSGLLSLSLVATGFFNEDVPKGLGLAEPNKTGGLATPAAVPNDTVDFGVAAVESVVVLAAVPNEILGPASGFGLLAAAPNAIFVVLSLESSLTTAPGFESPHARHCACSAPFSTKQTEHVHAPVAAFLPQRLPPAADGTAADGGAARSSLASAPLASVFGSVLALVPAPAPLLSLPAVVLSDAALA